MAYEDFTGYVWVPDDDLNTGDLEFTIKFNVNYVSAGEEVLRNQFRELVTSLRFTVNSTVVYIDDSNLTEWDEGDGDGNVSRNSTPETGNDLGSDAIWYKLSAGDVVNTGIELGVEFTLLIEMRDSPEDWWTAASQDLTIHSLPDKPTNPTPSDTDTGVAVSTSELSWTAGANTDTFNVYFGESGSEVLVAENQIVTDENWAIPPGTLDYGTVYGWRVDAVNTFGTTTGDTWTFTTLTFSPPTDASLVKRLVAAAKNKFYYEDI